MAIGRNFVMPEKPELSQAKRVLLDKYLRGEISPIDTAKSAAQSNGKSSPAPASTPTPTVPYTPTSMPVEENGSLRVPVVPIRTSGSRRPLFYSHVHVDGGAFYCFTLAERLGPDQPFYILEPYRFDDGELPPTLEEMASAYIESMRTVQPYGPYLLSGFCGGGLIVFEMAHQLRRQGEEVDLLLLVEPVDGPGPATYRMVLRTIAGRFVRGISKLFRIPTRQQLKWFLRTRHYYLLPRYPAYRKTHKPWLNPTTEMLYQDWIGIFVWIISAYHPKKYPGNVTYFWAKDEFLSRKEWRGKQVEAAEREMIMIPGDHWSCRTDHLREYADTLNQLMSKVQTIEPH
jgi:hypothetical protein